MREQTRRAKLRARLLNVDIRSDDDLFKRAKQAITRTYAADDQPNGVQGQMLIGGLPETVITRPCGAYAWPGLKKALYAAVEVAMGGEWEPSPFTKGTRFPKGTIARALEGPPPGVLHDDIATPLSDAALRCVAEWLGVPASEARVAERAFARDEAGRAAAGSATLALLGLDDAEHDRIAEVIAATLDAPPAAEPADPPPTPGIGALIYDADDAVLATRRTLLGSLYDEGSHTVEQLGGESIKRDHPIGEDDKDAYRPIGADNATRQLLYLLRHGLVALWRDRWSITGRGRQVVETRGDCAWTNDYSAHAAEHTLTPREIRLAATCDAALELLDYLDAEIVRRYNIGGFRRQIEQVRTLRWQAINDAV